MLPDSRDAFLRHLAGNSDHATCFFFFLLHSFCYRETVLRAPIPAVGKHTGLSLVDFWAVAASRFVNSCNQGGGDGEAVIYCTSVREWPVLICKHSSPPRPID